MLEAVIIGSGRSTPGLFSSRRRILRWRRFSWRRTLAFTRKPPGGARARVVKHLDCSRKPGGFRVPRPQLASNYAWLRSSRSTELVLEVPTLVGELPVDDGGLDDRLGAALRAALATGHRPLGAAEPPLALAEELGGGDRLDRGVAERGEVDQAGVDPDRLRGIGRRDRAVGHLELDDQ